MTTQQTQSATEPSPVRRTRVQEKEELAYLNDRFLSYIEQVRTMKESNLHLEIELQATKEQLGRETESVKALYESELADARNLIDETAKEKARQQIVASKNASRVDELEAELKALRDDMERLEARVSQAERNAASFDAQRKTAILEKGKLQKQVKDLEAELDELRSTLDSTRETLEAETLGKVDLQNHIQSLKEELAFRKKVYEEELASLRQKLSLRYTGVLEADFAGQLDGRLETAIDELRERSEMEIAQYKLEIEAVYKDKMAGLESQSSRDASTITKLNMEIRKISGSIGEHNAEIAKLQRLNDKLETALREKAEELSRVRQLHGEEIARLVDELRELRASYELKIREYEELMDIRIQLDQEIATYRALLQEEESRLNLTPTPREKRTRSRTQQATERDSASKRQRLEESSVSSHAAGFIQISDVDPDGKFIQIKNMSNQIESLGGFKIHHEVEDGEEVVFRFHHKSKLQGGAAVTVWGAKVEGATHNPPTDIIWRSQDTWGTSKKTITKLVSTGGEVVATFTQRSDATPSKAYQAAAASFETIDTGARSFPRLPEQQASSSSTSTATYSATYTTRGERQQLQQVGDEHVFHQKGDPSSGRTDKCRIS